ncbi:hypothetical protein Gotri_027325 [Gossypium trilobum]|uniref:Peptidase S8/S53 domain-containing protein n=1 Tax=Gossypium trilobum TaxID=34281 RepID=A0A7J9FLX0_9ROSI|nr:hypothetical protein [Gossypium trilobum]
MHAHYQVISGTSMASAVVAGMLSCIKSFHKDWGIARIKSAIMTSDTSRLGEEIVEAFQEYIDIFVEPDVLNFSNIEERKCFKMIIRSSMALKNQLVLAHATLIWREQKEDNGITVSSPVVILSTNLWKR